MTRPLYEWINVSEVVIMNRLMEKILLFCKIFTPDKSFSLPITLCISLNNRKNSHNLQRMVEERWSAFCALSHISEHVVHLYITVSGIVYTTSCDLKHVYILVGINQGLVEFPARLIRMLAPSVCICTNHVTCSLMI